MKQLLPIILLALTYSLTIAQNKRMIISPSSEKELEKFIKQTKFDKDEKMHYPGLGNKELKSPLTELINLSAKDFIEVAKNNPTEKNFQDQIKIGLNRFSKYYWELDSEDQDRICAYYEELMDIVGLQSSGGHLNMWRYGFDPTKK